MIPRTAPIFLIDSGSKEPYNQLEKRTLKTEYDKRGNVNRRQDWRMRQHDSEFTGK